MAPQAISNALLLQSSKEMFQLREISPNAKLYEFCWASNPVQCIRVFISRSRCLRNCDSIVWILCAYFNSIIAQRVVFVIQITNVEDVTDTWVCTAKCTMIIQTFLIIWDTKPVQSATLSGTIPLYICTTPNCIAPSPIFHHGSHIWPNCRNNWFLAQNEWSLLANLANSPNCQTMAVQICPKIYSSVDNSSYLTALSNDALCDVFNSYAN